MGLGLQSIWFGHGLGIHPADYLVEAVAKNRTPHNLGLQILTDSGLWGCLFAVFLSVIIFVKLRNLSLSVRPVCLYALVSLGLYSMVASTIFWPTGVWICSLFPALLPHERMLPGSESVRSSVASARAWLLMVMILALVCYLQVVLV